MAPPMELTGLNLHTVKLREQVLRFALCYVEPGSLLGEARSFCMGCLDSGRKPRQVDQPSLRACVLHDGSWGKELGLRAVPPRDPSTLCFLKHRLLAWGPGP